MVMTGRSLQFDYNGPDYIRFLRYFITVGGPWPAVGRQSRPKTKQAAFDQAMAAVFMNNPLI
jgi:hypothetical protein